MKIRVFRGLRSFKLLYAVNIVLFVTMKFSYDIYCFYGFEEIFLFSLVFFPFLTPTTMFVEGNIW